MEVGQDIERRERGLLVHVVHRQNRARTSKFSKSRPLELLLTDSQITTLQQALRNKPKLKLSILTDALRGTRESPDPSCASLLAPLVSEFGADRVEIRMYHTPNLTGLRKKYIPKRINEGWGLQHMKLYGMDDEIIISGYFSPSTEYIPRSSSEIVGPTYQTTTSQTAKTDTTSSPALK